MIFSVVMSLVVLYMFVVVMGFYVNDRKRKTRNNTRLQVIVVTALSSLVDDYADLSDFLTDEEIDLLDKLYIKFVDLEDSEVTKEMFKNHMKKLLNDLRGEL